MGKDMMATLRGSIGTSLEVLLSTALRAGDVLDLRDVTRLVPRGADHTRFFRDYVRFCLGNGSSRRFRVLAVSARGGGVEMRVAPAPA